jgi:hypothetical protein
MLCATSVHVLRSVSQNICAKRRLRAARGETHDATSRPIKPATMPSRAETSVRSESLTFARPAACAPAWPSERLCEDSRSRVVTAEQRAGDDNNTLAATASATGDATRRGQMVDSTQTNSVTTQVVGEELPRVRERPPRRDP